MAVPMSGMVPSLPACSRNFLRVDRSSAIINSFPHLLARLVCLCKAVSAVGDGERTVGLGRKLDPFALAVRVGIGDEIAGWVGLRGPEQGEVNLPDVLHAGRATQRLPRLRRAALPRTVAHDGYPGVEGLRQSRRYTLVLAVYAHLE